MRYDKFTQKAREALLEAQTLAEQYGHTTLEPQHLLKALLTQEGGVVPSVLNRIGADPAMIMQSVDQALAAMPRQEGGTIAGQHGPCGIQYPAGSRQNCRQHEG